MGRRKQSRPNRSGGIISGTTASAQDQSESENHRSLNPKEPPQNQSDQTDQHFFVEVDGSSFSSKDHFDVSEVILYLRVGEASSLADFTGGENYSLRFRLQNATELFNRMKLGHFPVLPSEDISLEILEKHEEETSAVVLSGSFDGQDEGVSGLVHLASLKLVTLRPVSVFFEVSKPSLRMRIEILRRAFDSCESLMENTRKSWKKSMISLMAWLRPEVLTSEARYGVSVETNADSSKSRRFDVAGFYEAIKPSKTDAMFEKELPDLLPELRPYQRRAVHWMVQREQGGGLQGMAGGGEDEYFTPLCLPVELLSGNLKMFYNPFGGNVAVEPENPPERIFGGILADEMGLGKTVEVLACVLAHPKESSKEDRSTESQATAKSLRRLKKERVECVCGAVREERRYKGLWVQCDMCDAWQHANCVGYSSRGKSVKAKQVHEETNGSKIKKKKNSETTIVERDGKYVCQLCLELLEATDSPRPSGATLIVCPAPILPQWSAEIARHTRPGALKTHVYDGVKDLSLSNRPVLDIEELINADIVLTTYDVLKEDLSHDSDRHEGDRRFLRFQKRYPVIPTRLTRILWWRVCLDEAQMVESSTTAATEMALRLHAKHRWCITGTPIQRKLDDLYGLLRFLKASPFNISRWWVEVLRDPYERRDAGAMEFTHKFFKKIMWRSSKVHVADELQLPPQEDCTSWLSFSPIEEHFYQRQHESCASFASEVIKRLKDDYLKRAEVSDASSDPFITHGEAGKLLNTLLKLRQACCHPQVGSSGLRSLQQSPMTMEEILMVLINKTKIEGEEALRRFVLALNGLAGIAMIETNSAEAAKLYKEALSVAEEHSEEFRLDPLLNIHILHNLSEVLPSGEGFLAEVVPKRHCGEKYGHVFKRRKLSSTKAENPPTEVKENGLNADLEHEDDTLASSSSLGNDSLRVACDSLKQKFLSAFTSRLSVAQEEFRKSYMQVCSAISELKNVQSAWWMEGLIHAEQNKDFSNELLRKIEEAVLVALNSSKSSRIPPVFRSISGMKYHIQNGLDQLEECRQVLLDQLLLLDQTMEKPKEEDILRVRYCQKCQVNGDGPLCVMCELDEMFQLYEARLFRFNNAQGGIITSAEEAVNLQKKNSALNRFYWNLSQPNRTLNSSADGYEESRKRDVREKVVVSKSPSEIEVVLGVIKNQCKAQLGREGLAVATKHLHMLEGMRKEYAHCRALAIAQTQVLQAHDEIKMATTRLELRLQDDDESLNALSKDELPSASVQYSSDKFVAENLLSCVKGKLRYLKGLVQAKQKLPVESPNSSSLTEEALPANGSAYSEQKSESVPKVYDEPCPICQETLTSRRMVFQCGHVTCCKCLFAMTEQKLLDDNKVRHKWVRCPTCRQNTDVGNIAYVDERQNEPSVASSLPDADGPESWGASIVVQGSYSTKIEAVTRRVLWIKSKDPKEKVLVFSTWNDVLDVLEHSFAANNISFIRMKGGRKSQIAISKFRQKCSSKGKRFEGEEEEEESVQVLLLLIQHGANGLNLLEAQHVVLAEPQLNPADEAQAISRVHRIGQQNKTLVHRFIVKDTVEESIYKLNRSRNTTSFVSRNTKNQDQPLLTLRDMESLFGTATTFVPETDEKAAESLRHLPPSVAASIAAERRLNNSTTQ